MRFRIRPTRVWGAVLCLGVAVAAHLAAQQPAPAPAATDAHAQQLLAAAQAAAGSASGLSGLKSLEVDYSQRRLVSMPTKGPTQGPVNEVSSDVKLQFLLPDNFRMDQAINLPVGMLGGGDLDLSMGLQNGQGWMKRTGGSFRFPGAGRPGGPGGRAPNPQDAARRQQMMTQRMQGEELRDLLLLTAWAPEASHLTYHYVGVAHAPDGSADVVDAHGPNDFTARLFLDQKTHRLLMMSYRDVLPFSGGPRGGSRGQRPGGPGGPGGLGAPGAGGPQANGPRPTPPLQDIELHLSDFSSEHGVMMPHKVVATVHGKPFEQWTIHKVKWNPQFHPSTFEKPSK